MSASPPGSAGRWQRSHMQPEQSVAYSARRVVYRTALTSWQPTERVTLRNGAPLRAQVKRLIFSSFSRKTQSCTLYWLVLNE